MMNYTTQHSADSGDLLYCNEVDDILTDRCVNADRISYLENTIGQLTLDVNELRDSLKSEGRELEQFENAILPRIEIKERELRHFLIPRSVHPEAGKTPIFSDIQPNPTTCTTIPIQSTVPAVRPVLSLVGGFVKTSSEGLLSANSSLTPLGNRSPTKPAPLPVTSTMIYSGQHPKQSFCSVDARRNRLIPAGHECASETDLYSKMPVDPSVLLVFSRLRRAQEHCSALVTTNQTDLQSFTFTQNSQNGKRIMMRVRILEQENQELSVLNRAGRAARLEAEITLRRHLLQDLKKAHVDMEHLVEEVEIETEMFGSSLLVLQQRLNLARTMAQVLASALAADEPSGQLLKALVSSEISPQSIDWLVDSLGLQDDDEEVVGECEEVHLPPISQKIDDVRADPTSNPELSIPTAPPLCPNKQKRVKRNRSAKPTKDKCDRTSPPTELPDTKCKKSRLHDEESDKLFTEPHTLQSKERVLSLLASTGDAVLAAGEQEATQTNSNLSFVNQDRMSCHRDVYFERPSTDCVLSNCREVTRNAYDDLALPQEVVEPHKDNDRPGHHENHRISIESESSSNSEQTSSLTNGDQST